MGKVSNKLSVIRGYEMSVAWVTLEGEDTTVSERKKNMVKHWLHHIGQPQ
jgi:hypothetical protein